MSGVTSYAFAEPAEGETDSQQAVALETITVVATREERVSSGATKLPLEIKETPQSISVIDTQVMEDFGATGTNEALKLGTGINVDQYETNRATFNSRGFEIQLTQVDGLGMTNSFGTVVGEQDTFLFEKIELIRGANGLLTGVGNASGTINYVRKRPTNEDGGKVVFTGGSENFARAAVDYNKVLTDDNAWAGRAVVAYEDKDSYLRAEHNERLTVYGVVDGQIGDNGVLTLGMTLTDSKQDSPMWGSLTLNYVDGTQADFDVSSSTSQDWTYWDTESQNAFIEYTHALNANWDAKFSYNFLQSQEKTRLLYAYSFTDALELDNTGLYGWPYSSYTEEDNQVLDVNLTGQFTAFGQQHSLIVGVSSSTQTTDTEIYPYDQETFLNLPLPAFPYAGNVYPEPEWQARTPDRTGEQTLNRLYAASRISLTEKAKAIVGVNVFQLQREGATRYGNPADQPVYPDTEEVSPYVGFTYDFTADILGYISYSDIFQNQDQYDFDGFYLDPTKGVNIEVGAKAEWLNRRLLTTVALFRAEQEGLATYGGANEDTGQYWYVPADVKSEGIELEATGQVSDYARLMVGITHLELTDPEGEDTFEWVPRTTVKMQYESRLPALPDLRLGAAGRWQSDTVGSYAKQDAYFVADAFVAYDLTAAATLRLNINNVFDEKYAEGLAYGAIYGEPLSGLLTFEYQM